MGRYFNIVSYITILIIFIGVPLNVVCADSILDSLQVKIQDVKSDTAKLNLIIGFINHTSFENDNEVELCYKKGKELSRSTEDKTFLLRLINACAKKYFVLGKNELSEEKYETLALESNAYKNTEFLIESKIGLARILFSKSENIQAKAMLNNARTIAFKNYPKLFARILSDLSSILRAEGKMDDGLALLDSSINILTCYNPSVDLAIAYSGKGRIYRQLGDNVLAKENYLEAEKISKFLNDQRSLSAIYNNLGNIAHVTGEYLDAITYYMNSKEIKEKSNNRKGIAIAIHNIAAIKFDMKSWDSALEGFIKADEIAREIEFKILSVLNLWKIGNIYQEKQEYITAIEFHNDGLNLAKEIDYPRGVIGNSNGLGVDYLSLNRFSEAYDALFNGLELAEKIGSKPYQSALLVSIANLYHKDNEINSSNNLEFSTLSYNRDWNIEQLLLNAKKFANEMNNAENKLAALEGLNAYYQSTNNYYKISIVSKELIAIKDSLFSEQRNKAITEWEAKYLTNEQEKEILKLENEKKLTALKAQKFKEQIIWFFILTGLLGFISYIILKQNNAKRKAKERESFRSKLSSDLHDDVGSILTGIAMQSELLSMFVDESKKSKVEDLATMSRDAMERMRDTIWAIDSRKDKMQDLKDRILDHAENSFQLKNIELFFDENLADNEQKINPEIRQNTFLIFKEAIANILKYSSCDKVEVSVNIKNKHLMLKVHDNGNLDNIKIKTSGTGLSNMRMRAEKLGGNFSFDATSGFKILVDIPL